MAEPLTEETFRQALALLCARDADLARVVGEFGPPPFWARPPGFATLVWIILEQQVSLASARAAYDRLCALADPPTPERFLSVDGSTLRQIGFSRQKTGYCRGLAQVILDGRLRLEMLDALDDLTVREELVRIKGIGPWTADIYLLMALRRPDAWPVHDLALAVAVHKLKRLASRPRAEELEALGGPWRPWRAVAARILWHYYLTGYHNLRRRHMDTISNI